MIPLFLFLSLSVCAFAIERRGVEYKVFQFPADKIPRIDGDPSDWSIVPETYSIGMDQLNAPWQPGTVDVDAERIITRIEGSRVMIDEPLTTALDQQYGGGSYRFILIRHRSFLFC